MRCVELYYILKRKLNHRNKQQKRSIFKTYLYFKLVGHDNQHLCKAKKLNYAYKQKRDHDIYFLSLQERLDFAMKEIIFDLLSVGKSPKTFTINPEVKKNLIASMQCESGIGGLFGGKWLTSFDWE